MRQKRGHALNHSHLARAIATHAATVKDACDFAHVSATMARIHSDRRISWPMTMLGDTWHTHW